MSKYESHYYVHVRVSKNVTHVELVNTMHFNNRGSVSFLLLLQLHCYYLLYNRQRCWMILISNPIMSEINRVNNCGHSSKICGKKNNLPLILTKSQNPQTKNLKFKAVPGTLRDWDHHHWIPEPILAQNGFDSPPLNPNRGLRGRNRPLPGTDHWAKKKYNIDYDVINGRKYLKRLTLHMIHSAHDQY